MGRRSALLIGGLVLATLGTFLVFIYANNAQETVAAEVEVVTAYVAATPVAVGTPGSAVAANLQETELPTSAVPAGAVVDPETIGDAYAVVPIAAGQVALEAMFGDPANVPSLPISKGQMGVAVQLGDAQRVAGFVIPGSEVAVFSTFDGEDEIATRLLLDRATVAAVGPTTIVNRTSDNGDEQNVEEIPTAILTLALNQKDAEKLIYAQQETQLHFALLTPRSDTTPGPGVTADSLFRN